MFICLENSFRSFFFSLDDQGETIFINNYIYTLVDWRTTERKKRNVQLSVPIQHARQMGACGCLAICY